MITINKNNNVYGIADTASVITCIISGLTQTTGNEIPKNKTFYTGILLTNLHTLFTTIADFSVINEISLINSSSTEITNVKLYTGINTTKYQFIPTLRVLPNGSTIYSNGQWKILNSEGIEETNTSVSYITNIDTSTPNITYIGKAVISTLNSEAKWQIRLIDETTSTVTILYADGTDGFIKVWDDRLTYIYS